VILTGYAIEHAVANGDIEIDPFERAQLNPASYDLTLGDLVLVYDFDFIHDVKSEPKKLRHARIGDEGFVIHPGIGYLMCTRERVKTNHHVAVIDGKSSLGRLFISVHQTAGYGDPGFDGQYTLEVTTLYSIRLYAGMKIAQIRFHETTGVVMPYRGNYVGEGARGPVPSRAWRQFK
jgi:dCTP deaminase